jgi:peptidyl-prolyl cis-trans isomerase A (cyclophilin A)
MRYFLVFVLMALLGACGGSDKSSRKTTPKQVYGSHSTNAKAMVQLKLLNHYNQEIGMAYGIFIDKNLVVANLSDIKGCYKLKVATWGTDQYSDVEGYLAFDPKSDLVLLRTFVRTKKQFIFTPMHLCPIAVTFCTKTKVSLWVNHSPCSPKQLSTPSMYFR